MKPPVIVKIVSDAGLIELIKFYIGSEMIFEFVVLNDKKFFINHEERRIEFKTYSYCFAKFMKETKLEVEIMMTNKNASLLLFRCIADCEYESHNDDKDQIKLTKDFLNLIYG